MPKGATLARAELCQFHAVRLLMLDGIDRYASTAIPQEARARWHCSLNDIRTVVVSVPDCYEACRLDCGNGLEAQQSWAANHL